MCNALRGNLGSVPGTTLHIPLITAGEDPRAKAGYSPQKILGVTPKQKQRKRSTN